MPASPRLWASRCRREPHRRPTPHGQGRAGQDRCTAIALGNKFTLGVVSGPSPLAAAWLGGRTENDYSPAFMIMAAAAISFAAILKFEETCRGKLQTA